MRQCEDCFGLLKQISEQNNPRETIKVYYCEVCDEHSYSTERVDKYRQIISFEFVKISETMARRELVVLIQQLNSLTNVKLISEDNGLRVLDLLQTRIVFLQNVIEALS